MKRKHIITAILVALLAVPAFAVFNERNLERTLSVLKFELEQVLRRGDSPLGEFHDSHEQQHQNMVTMIQKCNELSLILYSQNQDFTFDMTYALEEVTDQYETFNREKMPYDEILSTLDIEIDRYERLIESLKRLPPALYDESDSLDVEDHDGLDSLVISEHNHEHGHGHSHDHELDFDGYYHPAEGPEGHNHDHDHMESVEVSKARLNIENDALQSAISIITGIEVEDEEDEHLHGNPFVLDEHGQAYRDSCLSYANTILQSYVAMKEHIEEDSEHYNDMSLRLKDAYDYAQDRYRQLQKRIFIQGQDNYLVILKTFPSYVRKAFSDAKAKYGQVKTSDGESAKSSWRGPVVVGFIFFVLVYLLVSVVVSRLIIAILSRKVKAFMTEEFRKKSVCMTLIVGVIIFLVSVMTARSVMSQNFFVVASRLLLVYAWLLLATLASLYIRSAADQVRPGLKLYAPVLILGLIVITFRIIFIPNKVVNLLYPPILVLFSIWQLRSIGAARGKVLKIDMIYAHLSLVLMVVTAVITLVGYVLLGVQVFIFWLFQLTAIATVTAFYDLLKMYERVHLRKSLEQYRQEHTVRIGRTVKGTYITVTWLFDMLEMAVIPVVAVASLPFCIWMASQVFDLKEICRTIFMHPFFNFSDVSGNAILHLSLFKMVVVVSLYFVFRYLNYLIKSVYRHYKLESVVKVSGQDYVHANQVNLTLANNLIGIVLWGLYIIIAIVLLKIPMGALSVVAAGLATGIGLAMKDVLNNFIYGIQLMSGRLRVGDYIECDGVRGKVDRISYQSTTVETLEGAVMAFTNSTLFAKNFKNLTRNNSYELVKIPVGVHYGANIAEVRKMLAEALKQLEKTDKYGREVVDRSKGITVAFSDFGDSSVDLVVKQYVLVEEGPAYIAKAKEIIYDTLNKNGVEIPYPQRDVYIRQVPSSSNI